MRMSDPERPFKVMQVQAIGEQYKRLGGVADDRGAYT